MNKIYSILLIGFILSVTMNLASASDSFVILDSTDVQTMLDNIEYIESNGGKITHKFPPNILIGDIPADKINSFKGKMNIVEIKTDIIDNSTMKKFNKKMNIAANIWNNVFKHLDKDKVPGPTVKPKPLIDDVKFLNNTDKKVTIKPYSSVGKMPPYGAGFYDTSEYMIGDVAVGIILLESNGAIDSDTEDWTPSEESNVISGIVRGLSWWASEDPKARLTFTYDIYYQTPTNYEPISRPYSDQYLWIQDAMKDIGFNQFGSYFDNVYDYNNRLRESMGTDWAYTIFVVDSSNDIDGQFSGGYFAYAYLGGPFTVLTYDNDGWGIANMDKVSAHETGHIFYATDEYNGYTEYSGYLNARDIEYSGCIMDSNGWCISSGTALQLGWRDSNNNFIFDIIDFNPYGVWKDSIINGNTAKMSGTSYATDVYPNHNPRGTGNFITINKIINVQYRVDYGNWQNAQPYDGLFDNSIEDFIFTTYTLSEGYHTIDVRSRNTAGIWESPYLSKTIKIESSSITVASPNGGENWQTGSTHSITWSSTGNPGNVNIELLKGGGLDSAIVSNVPNSGSYNWIIPSGQISGTDYKVKITSTTNSAYTDSSDNTFTISSPPISITVVSPNGGEIWQSGSTQIVRWSYKGNPGSNVEIDLLKSGSSVKTIASGVSIGSSGSGTYSWKMSLDRIPGNDYQVRITSTSDSTYTDTSDNYFTISSPQKGITVTSPNGGENWKSGDTKTIKWKYTNLNINTKVNIDLLQGGSTVKQIASNVNGGSYKWKIGKWSGNNFQIKMTTTDGQYTDTSDGYFKIS